MDNYYPAFKLFREKHWGWGGKNKFKPYFKIIHCNKEGDFGNFLIQCVTAKILNERKIPFVCNIHINKKFHKIFNIESDQSVEIKKEIPEEVREAIKTIRDYAELQLESS